MAKGYVANLDFGKLEKEMVAAGKVGLERAAIFLEGKLKELLSEPYPPVSEPGEPPHRRSGDLRAFVSHEARNGGMVQRVGTPFRYGFFLEFGVPDHNLKPRPWLRAGLAQNEEPMRRIVKVNIAKAMK